MALHSIKAFDKHVLALKGVTVHEQWEAHVAKIGGKVFALIGETGSPIVFKVTEMSFEGLTEIEGIRQAAYFAKRAWVAVDKAADLPDADLKAYIRQSYVMVASRLTRKAKAELGLDF
jgi:predicted DNA-binding protein (MmcQ/YjbR family)